MMKNRRLHTIILPLCTLLLFSCTQDNISPASDTENEIRFQTGTTTRGLIDNLAQAGTKITLYGYHGTDVLAKDKKPLAGKSLTYMDGRWAVVDDTDTQNPNNPITYFWEGNGDYRFFGWLKQDPNGLQDPDNDNVNNNDDKWSAVYNEGDKKLTVNATLDQEYNQFDFMYSDVDERTLTDENMANEKGRAVAMNMNHLFSAFSIGLSNQSKKKITIKEVILKHIDKQGNATINYSDDSETGDGKVVYNITESNNSTGPFLTYEPNPGYEVAMGSVKRNIFSPEAQEKQYYMVWPQNLPVLNFATEDEEEKAEESLFPLVLRYTVEGDNTVITKKMKIPHTNWEPGKKYSYEVLIADKIVTLNYTVKDWDEIKSNVDFKKGTVTVATPLDWENGETNADGTTEKNTCIVDNDSKKVYVLGAQAVEATFGFATPQGGQWRVSLKGDTQKFKIENSQGPIDNNLHRIRILPTVINPEEDCSVELEFVVITADGETHIANVVQTHGHDQIYSIVQQKAN